MRVCHLSQTPIAGACWSWSEAFREAGYNSWSCSPGKYGDGRMMPFDSGYPPDDHEIQMIHESDLIICYQGNPYTTGWYPKGKPTVVVYVSQPFPRHINRQAEQDGWPWAVIGEYQTRLYPGCDMVPNLIPLSHPWFQPGDKPADTLRIAYSPSNTGQDHRHVGSWDDKGFPETEAVLSWMATLGCDIDIITGVPLQECMARKSRAHIVIDECKTGSYHGNSLQGLALGCVVLNAADNKALANLAAFSGGAPSPFDWTPMSLLEGRLKVWNVRGPGACAEQGRKSRAWMDKHYQPGPLIEKWFVPLMDAAFKKAGIA